MPPLNHAHAVVVDAALAEARAGTPTVLLVEGEPGSGKTTLLSQCRERAVGFAVVAVDALEPEIASAPYATLLDLGVQLDFAHPPPPWPRVRSPNGSMNTPGGDRCSCASTMPSGLTNSR